MIWCMKSCWSTYIDEDGRNTVESGMDLLPIPIYLTFPMFLINVHVYVIVSF